MTEAAIEAPLDALLKGLVLRARQGDKAAYRELLSRAAHLIRRMVAGRIGKWGQQHYVEDVTQDTLLSIHLKLHTYNDELPFHPWINAIARHKLIDNLRKIKGVQVSLDDETLPELTDPTNPEEVSVGLDIEKLLSHLKPPTGDIIRALKIDGSSIKELASKYKMSEANIKVTVHRGLQKLSDLVREA